MESQFPLVPCSVAKSSLTVFDPMDCSMPGFAVLHCLPEFAQTHVHWVGDAIQPSHPLLPLLLLPSSLSEHLGLSIELALFIRWSKYWSFSSSISPSGEYSGLISFKIDWIGLLLVQLSLRSLLQHHNSKTLILLYGPPLTFRHDYGKNHSFDYMDLCQQSDVSVFEYSLGLS